MKILKISILNFLGIGSFKSDSLGKLNRIEGGNGVGKSSVLKAITESIKSSGNNPNLIKQGSDKAEIMIELDNNIQIERRITQSANSAKVVVNGQPINKPQTYLDNLIGPFIFNPVEFFMLVNGNAEAKRKARQLLLSSIEFQIDKDSLIGELGELLVPEVDLNKFDYSKHGLDVLAEIKNETYDRRKEVNLNLTRLKKAIEQDKLDIPNNFNRKEFEDFDLNNAVEELSAKKVSISDHNNKVERLQQMRQRGTQIVSEVETLKAKVKSLEEELETLNVNGKALKSEIEGYVEPDISELQSKIESYKQSQKLINKLEEIDRKSDEAEKLELVHKALDEMHSLLANEVPKKMLSQVSLPIEGLALNGDDIAINGVSIQNLSTSEQIRFSLAIAKSLAKELKVVCIDRFESLDKSTQELFEKETDKDGFEYFVTVVTDGDLSMDSTGEFETVDKETGEVKSVPKPTGTQLGF